MQKLLVTPRSFGKTDPSVFERLTDAGYEVIRNPYGSILTEEQLIESLEGCEGLIVGVDPVSRRVIESAVNLKAIAKYGVGIDNIDLDACKEKNISVSRTVGANSSAVADYAFALILAVTRRVVLIDQKCRQDDWGKLTTSDVDGKTIGLLGLGAIGRKVAKRAAGFDMKVLAYDPYWDEDYAKAHGIIKAEPDQIYQNADFISLHLPLTDETKNMIAAREIEMMKPTAVIINTARGGLIEEEALLEALINKRIYGAGIDAFSQEPLADRRWYELDNIVMGSHTAASTFGATEQMGQMAVTNLLKDLSKVK
jgi:D-3-phosphoglycerate dehydrogenase